MSANFGGTHMLDTFRSRFSDNLKSYRLKIASSPFLLSLIGPFYGISDHEVYDKWKLSSDMNYFEVSNLIDAMEKSPSPSLVQMARDLVSEGYDKTPSADFDPRKVDEQLALISAILSDGFPDVLEEILDQEKKLG